MIGVSQQGDKVIVDLSGHHRDILLSCSQAGTLCAALCAAANGAELATPEIVKGDAWLVNVESYDGYVAIRFHPPTPGYPARVPIPFAAARQLASRISFKSRQAAHKMRLVFRAE